MRIFINFHVIFSCGIPTGLMKALNIRFPSFSSFFASWIFLCYAELSRVTHCPFFLGDTQPFSSIRRDSLSWKKIKEITNSAKLRKYYNNFIKFPLNSYAFLRLFYIP